VKAPTLPPLLATAIRSTIADLRLHQGLSAEQQALAYVATGRVPECSTPHASQRDTVWTAYQALVVDIEGLGLAEHEFEQLVGVG
jgi:hypothetical protein